MKIIPALAALCINLCLVIGVIVSSVRISALGASRPGRSRAFLSLRRGL